MILLIFRVFVFFSYAFAMILLPEFVKLKIGQFCMQWVSKFLGLVIHTDAGTQFIISNGMHKPTLYLSNHISYVDLVVLKSILNCNFLSKSEVRKWPIIGVLAKSIGTRFVDREVLTSCVSALNRLKKDLKHAHFLVFPEGSTTSSVCPNRLIWKAGQLWSADERHVVTIGMHYLEQQEIAWTDDMSLVPHLVKFFLRKETHVFLTAQSVSLTKENFRVQSQGIFESVRDLCLSSQARSLRFQVPRTQ